MLRKKEKLANAICPGHGVLDTAGAGLKGLFTSGLRTGRRRSLSFEAYRCPSCPHAIPVNPV